MEMFAFFTFLVAAPAVLNVPAWLYARRRRAGTTPPILVLGAPAIVVWVLLTMLGVGAQSLSNLVETLMLAALSVVLCYGQVFLLDRLLPSPRRTSLGLAAGLILVGVLLRLFMPLLPE